MKLIAPGQIWIPANEQEMEHGSNLFAVVINVEPEYVKFRVIAYNKIGFTAADNLSELPRHLFENNYTGPVNEHYPS